MALTPKTVSSPRNYSGHDSEETPVVQSRKLTTVTTRGDGFVSSKPQVGANQAMAYAVGEYSFKEDGALASGAIFGTGVFVPANAVVTEAGLYTDILVVGPDQIEVTLYGAGVGATASADANIVAAASVASVIGTSKIGVPVPATAGTWIHTGAHPREILLGFSRSSPAATTAGRVFAWVKYMLITQGTPTAHGDSI